MSTITIDTRLGSITGRQEATVQQYLGIRYAEPPVGTLRFAPPSPSGGWSDTYDATEMANRAVQAPTAELLGGTGPGEPDEDCLFLNVYTPAADASKRPVLCWIHGGGFTSGSANDYDASMLAAQGDVVVVAINYRLGLFGFLDLSSHGSPYAGSASNGFRDQITALEWIRDNVADYGGDPSNVTIFGESAGGGSVVALLASPDADGLYHKAIAHSPGGVNTPSVDQLDAIDPHIAGDGPLLDRLLAATSDELLVAQTVSGAMFGEIDGTVVTQHPAEAVGTRPGNSVPLIAGTNLHEGTLFSAIMGELPGAFDAVSMAIASQVMRGADAGDYLVGLKDESPDMDDTAIYEEVWVDLFRRTAVEVAAASTGRGTDAWLYRFDLPTTALDGVLGATHAAEIAFTFNWPAAPADVGLVLHDRNDPVVRELAEQWSNTIIAFARTGSPNGAGLPEWAPYGEGDRGCLILDGEPRIEHDPDARRRQLWT